MASFELPPIQDNPDGGWGPPQNSVPQDFKFKDIPYAPFSKADKLGRFADWNDLTGEGRQTTAGLTSGARTTGTGSRRREGPQAFGSGLGWSSCDNDSLLWLCVYNVRYDFAG